MSDFEIDQAGINSQDDQLLCQNILFYEYTIMNLHYKPRDEPRLSINLLKTAIRYSNFRVTADCSLCMNGSHDERFTYQLTLKSYTEPLPAYQSNLGVHRNHPSTLVPLRHHGAICAAIYRHHLTSVISK